MPPTSPNPHGAFQRPLLRWLGLAVARQEITRITVETLRNEHKKYQDFGWNDGLRRCLREHFGHERFRPMQLEVCNAVVEKKDDIIVQMATAYGKSLCYLLPVLCEVSKGVTIVLMPHVALIEDQVGLPHVPGTGVRPPMHSSVATHRTTTGSPGERSQNQRDLAPGGRTQW